MPTKSDWEKIAFPINQRVEAIEKHLEDGNKTMLRYELEQLKSHLANMMEKEN